MCNACSIRQGCFSLAFAAISVFGGLRLSVAEPPERNFAAELYSMIGAQGHFAQPAGNPSSPPATAQPRGPLARLVVNPDRSSGAPPFALSDQGGAIQRYVEPVPGIDLGAYVGQVVVVRHDTGQTLLASQLELPPQALTPLIGEAGAGADTELTGSMPASRARTSSQAVRLAQYIDNDDATVQLLPENEEAAGPQMEMMSPDPISGQMVAPDMQLPAFPGEMISPGMAGPGYGAPYCDPTNCGSGVAEMYPAETMMGMEPCPRCGVVHGRMGAAQHGSFGQCSPKKTRYYGDIEFNFFRPTLSENVVGKLSESYQFSPRLILGFDGIGNLAGRARYWDYGRDIEVLNDDKLRLEFKVLDLEGTHRVVVHRTEVILAAGLRVAEIGITDDADEESDCNLAGLTMAADGNTALVAARGGRLAWVYGGRLSLLGGNWAGEDDSQFVNERVRDDNVLVHELYAGAQFNRRYRNLDLHARLVLEMQNWHSDVLAEDADVESIGFVGPGIQLGADF